ncbi:MAG: hypothetical protein JSW47_05455 [Phycisphaerales bacterium]|nr:MAG: hypothetical protein JSW47_05455 [Phycisphaerales bacterium]
MKQIITTLLILTCAVAFVGCKDGPIPPKQKQETEPNVSEPNVPEPNEPPSTDIPAMPPKDSFEITGTVVFKNIEGGFFAIDGDDGRKYDPIDLPENFRKDGMKVKLTARLKRDAVSFHMYGSIIEVVNIAAQ